MMDYAQPGAFRFQKFKVPVFSFQEPGSPDYSVKMKFNPSGKYFQKTGNFELHLDFLAYNSDIEGSEKDPVIKTTTVSYFQFESPLKFSEIPPYFYMNAIAISFPYLRSFISTLTVQAGIKIVMLPIMNLSSLEKVFRDNTKVVDE